MIPVPRSPQDALLVQLTDTHLSADPAARLRGIVPARTLQGVLELARPWTAAADRLVLTGDLTHDGSGAAAGHLHRLIAATGAPYSHLPGNHDDPATLAQHLDDPPAQWPHRVRIKAWDLLLLDSRVPGREGGELGAAQLGRLERLVTADPERPALIAVHHHPVPIGSPWMDAMALADGPQLLALLGGHPRVRGVIFGHVHQRFERQIGHLYVLGTPSTCMQFEPHSRDAHSDRRLPGFRWLALRADGRLENGVQRLAAWPDGTAPTS